MGAAVWQKEQSEAAQLGAGQRLCYHLTPPAPCVSRALETSWDSQQEWVNSGLWQ